MFKKTTRLWEAAWTAMHLVVMECTHVAEWRELPPGPNNTLDRCHAIAGGHPMFAQQTAALDNQAQSHFAAGVAATVRVLLPAPTTGV